MNNDLIKQILEYIENSCKGERVCQLGYNVPENLSADRLEVFDNCRLIIEEGLANGEHCSAGYYFTSLTMEGYKFLDNSKKSRFQKFLDKNYNGSFIYFLLSLMKLK